MRLRKLSILALTLLVAVSGIAFINPKRAFATPGNCSWTGSAGDSMFSTAANWSGCNGTYPQAGDNIIFGTPVGGRTVSLTGVSEATYGSITFNDNDYYIEQGRMDVTGGVTDNSTGGENRILSDLGVYGSSVINGGNSNLVLDNAIVGSSSTVSFSHVTAYQLSGGGGVPSVLNIGPGVTIDDASAGGLTGVNINNDFQTGGALTGGPITVASGATFTVSIHNTVTGEVDVSNGGTLVLAGTVTGNIAVANGGTVKGEGTESGATTIQQGGVVAPGNIDGPGCLTAGNLTVNGTYQAEIGGTTACTGYDQLTGTNLVDVTNGTLNVTLVSGFTPSAGQTFIIVNNQNTGAVTGTFSGLAEGSTVTASGYTFKISYVGGDGNDIVLTAVGPAAGANGPGSPNTGLAALAAHPLATLAAAITAAAVIFCIARRLQPVKQ